MWALERKWYKIVTNTIKLNPNKRQKKWNAIRVLGCGTRQLMIGGNIKKKKRAKAEKSVFVAFRSWRSAWVAINSPKACDNDRWHRQQNKERPNQNHDIRLAILFILIMVCVPCWSRTIACHSFSSLQPRIHISLFSVPLRFIYFFWAFYVFIGHGETSLLQKNKLDVLFFTCDTIDTSNTLNKQ